MKYISEKYYGYDEDDSNKMFLLGYLHDQIYEFETEEIKHDELMYQLLQEGLGLREEVRYHSEYPNGYKSDVMDMLYFTNQIVDGNGNIGTFDDRLSDILERHGTNDGVYQKTLDLVNYLSSHRKFVTMEKDVTTNVELKETVIPVLEMKQVYEESCNTSDPKKYLENIIKNSAKHKIIKKK